MEIECRYFFEKELTEPELIEMISNNTSKRFNDTINRQLSIFMFNENNKHINKLRSIYGLLPTSN